MRRGLTAALALAAGLYGCTFLFPLGDLTGSTPVAQPVIVAPAGRVNAPTGNAQQAHAFWASAANEWVLMYLDDSDPTTLQTVASADFGTWNTLPSTQPFAGPIVDGRDFSIGTASIRGADVVHLAISEEANGTRQHEHARAHFDPSAGVVVDSPVVMFQGTGLTRPGLDPDGPATALTIDDHVVDMSSWIDDGASDGGGAGDPFAWVSNAQDTGNGNWQADFGLGTELQMVTLFVNSHAVVPLDNGDVLAFWDSADQQPLPTNVFWSMYQAGSWLLPGPDQSVFNPQEAAAEDQDDWAVVDRSGGEVHAVRYTHAKVFEHQQFDGSGWVAREPIPGILDEKRNAVGAVSPQGGLVMTSDGTYVHLFAISGARGNPIVSTTLRGGWTEWRPVVAAGATRRYLTAAQSSASSSEVALFWTEDTGNGSFIEGALVTPVQ